MEHANLAMIIALAIVAVALEQQWKNRGRKIDELTDRLNSEMINSEKLRLELSANRLNEPHYAVYVDGLLKFTFRDYYHVTPLSRFGKNVYVVRNGKPIKWIGKGKEMYHKNYCGSEMAAS